MMSKKVKRIGISAALVVAMAFSASTMAVSAAEATTPPATAPATPVVTDKTDTANGRVEVNNTAPNKAEDYDATDEVTSRTVDPTAEDDPTTDDVNEAEAAYDTDIDVWGFTEDATVYSVDVEWGAMTFRYTTGTWDPENHVMKTDAGSIGWEVYDSVADKPLGDIQHEINRVTVTNHSNADVWAQLTYQGKQEAAEDYTETVGVFAKSEKTGGDAEDSADTVVTVSAAADDTSSNTSLIALKTANNGTGGAAGTPTKGVTYFKPKNISDNNKTNGIAKWTTIGKITVAVSTTDPTPPTGP